MSPSLLTLKLKLDNHGKQYNFIPNIELAKDEYVLKAWVRIMLFFLPGRKHAVKPLFAHRRVSLEEFMLLYGLEVRAFLPEVAPRLAFDNNEQTGAFLWFSHFRLHHVTMIVVSPRVAVKGLALLRTNPFFIKGYNYYSQGKFKNIILHTDEIQGMKFNKFFFFFFFHSGGKVLREI